MVASLALNASVIVHDLNFVRIPLAPNEAKTPLVVNSNAILSLAVAMHYFQAISGRRCQIAQFRGAIQLPQLAPRDPLDSLKAAARLPALKSPSFLAAERLNHGLECILLSV
jgi:hypothetical protein